MKLLAAINFNTDTVRFLGGFKVMFIEIERADGKKEGYAVGKGEVAVVTQMKGKTVLGAMDAKGD
jgi:hypothetical protein